jgi:hypothetical protein
MLVERARKKKYLNVRPKFVSNKTKLYYGHRNGKCRCGGYFIATQYGESHCDRCGLVKKVVWSRKIETGKRHGTEGENIFDRKKDVAKTFLEQDVKEILARIQKETNEAVLQYLHDHKGWYFEPAELAVELDMPLENVENACIRLSWYEGLIKRKMVNGRVRKLKRCVYGVIE